jgi:hypothetical protein
MSTQPFLRPRLTGIRFEGGSIPLEFLKDLAVLEEMIVEVAKSEFLKDHPGRQRSPRGFTEGIELKLTGIEEGSAIPVISLVVAAMTLFPPENQAYFERARDSIIDAIGAAERNQSITDYLPERSLSYFDRIGRSLRDGEAIEFTAPDRPAPAKLTKETRRRLVLASSKVKGLTEATEVRGTVPEADQDDMTFEVQLIDGRKIKGPLDAQHFDTIIEAFNNYQTGTRILLQGIGQFNRNERLLSFDSIEHVSILDTLDIPARLEELRSLKDGWLEGQGQAPSLEGMEWLARAFGRHYPDDLQLPFLYPTAERGIQAEWSLPPNEVTLNIDLEKKSGDWHTLNTETDDEESRELTLQEADDWHWFIKKIRMFGGGLR